MALMEFGPLGRGSPCILMKRQLTLQTQETVAPQQRVKAQSVLQTNPTFLQIPVLPRSSHDLGPLTIHATPHRRSSHLAPLRYLHRSIPNLSVRWWRPGAYLLLHLDRATLRARLSV